MLRPWKRGRRGRGRGERGGGKVDNFISLAQQQHKRSSPSSSLTATIPFSPPEEFVGRKGAMGGAAAKGEVEKGVGKGGVPILH